MGVIPSPMECIHLNRPHPGQLKSGEIFRRFCCRAELMAIPKKQDHSPDLLPQIFGATGSISVLTPIADQSI